MHRRDRRELFFPRGLRAYQDGNDLSDWISGRTVDRAVILCAAEECRSVLLHRTTSRFANFSSAGRQSTMNSSSRVFRQCLRVRVGVIRAVSAAAVCTFVMGASAQACGRVSGPALPDCHHLVRNPASPVDGNAGPLAPCSKHRAFFFGKHIE